MIKDNIHRIKGRVAQACSRVNRDASSVIIVGVSKGRQPEEIKEAIDAGIVDIGENKVQEALKKYESVSGYRLAVPAGRTPNTEHRSPMRWHMIGHLQTNKAKEAVKLFDLIHSVDSLRLAKEIDKQAVKISKVQDILLEVNTSGEASKFGLKPEEVSEIIKDLAGLKNINLKGLMTIAPLVDDPEQIRHNFRKLREFRDEINMLLTVNCKLSTLSMGMSDDFEVAIEEGANMIRIGRAIFEA